MLIHICTYVCVYTYLYYDLKEIDEIVRRELFVKIPVMFYRNGVPGTPILAGETEKGRRPIFVLVSPRNGPAMWNTPPCPYIIMGIWLNKTSLHYSDVIMSAMASQITGVSIVYSTVFSGTDQRKHQSSALLALCAGNTPVTGEFSAQRASNAEDVSILWRHHEIVICDLPTTVEERSR